MPAAVRQRTDAAGDGDSPVRPWALALRRLLLLAGLGAGATIGCLLLAYAAHAHSGGSSPSVPGLAVTVRAPLLPSGVTRAVGHPAQGARPTAAGPSRPAGRSQPATRRPLPARLYGSSAPDAPPALVRSVTAPLASVVVPVVKPVLGSPALGLVTPAVGPVLAPVTAPVLRTLAPAVGIVVAPTSARVGGSPAMTARAGAVGLWRSYLAGTPPVRAGNSLVPASLPVDSSTVPRAPVAPALPPPLESAGAGNVPAAPSATSWLSGSGWRPNTSPSRFLREAHDRLSSRASRPGTSPD
jgi:hypothetical protein